MENLQRDEPLWILVQEYALSDKLDVYLRHPDGHVEHTAGGDHVPFADRFIRYRHPNFRLDLPAGERMELLVRVQSESSMQVPLALYTPKAFAELLRDAQFSNGLYYGIVLALLCYNLVLWLMLRDASYFWYLLHTGAFGLVLFTLNGYGFEYLWPTSTWLADASIPLPICLALIGMQLFARSFLDLRTRWPTGDKVCLGVVAFFAALGVAATWLPYSIATPIASRAVLLGVAWIIIATVVMLRRGYQPARLFLLAWSLFLSGTAAFTLLAFGALPQNFWTQNGVQIGSALELLLLSLALGKRYASLREENIRIVQETNEKLERGLIDRPASCARPWPSWAKPTSSCRNTAVATRSPAPTTAAISAKRSRRCWNRARAAAARSPCCCWTWTSSSGSTTATATRPATAAWSKRRAGSRKSRRSVAGWWPG